jgi:hypothetical protein
MSDNTETRALRWALGRHVGESSKTMAAAMMGFPNDAAHPWDVGDFWRCVRLLNAVPEWRQSLDKMKTVSPYWAVLVEHWSELEAMLGRDDRGLYDRMRALFQPIEKRDRNVINLGGVAVHVRD